MATQYIPKGTITWVMDKLDRVLSEKQIQELGSAYLPLLTKYTFRDSRGRYVLCWDLAKYVNHSFHPNSLTTAHDFELAIHDIHPGDQITNHYGYLNLAPQILLSDDGTAEQWVTKEDVLKHAADWDQVLTETIRTSRNVAQPLEDFLSPKMKFILEAANHDPTVMKSVRTCYFDEQRKQKIQLKQH